MKKILLIIFMLAIPSVCFAQGSPPLGIRDEGGAVSRPTNTINCVGSAIECTHSGSEATITISSTGGGDSVSVNGGAVVDPDFTSDGIIDLTNVSNSISLNIEAGTLSDTLMVSTADFMQGGFGITVDGGGSAITTGIKGYVEVPYDCDIISSTMLADQSGSITIDIWKDSFVNYPPTDADSITSSTPPTIASNTNTQDTTLTSWTTSVSAGDVVGFNVDSATTVTRANLNVKCTKN